MNNKEMLSKKLRVDRVTLFVQFWFKFANKKHFKNLKKCKLKNAFL